MQVLPWHREQNGYDAMEKKNFQKQMRDFKEL